MIIKLVTWLGLVTWSKRTERRLLSLHRKTSNVRWKSPLLIFRQVHIVLTFDLLWNYLLYRAKVSTTGADQRLDIEVQCHSILAELCWVEANGKDGQADKDFDEHAKVEKDRINWNWDDINLLKVWHERHRGTRIVCQKEKVAFFTLTPHLLFILTFWLNISQPWSVRFFLQICSSRITMDKRRPHLEDLQIFTPKHH